MSDASTTEIPQDHEIRAVWRRDAPLDMAWSCPDCVYRATLGCNAASHAMRENHGVPTLAPYSWPIPPRRTPKPLPGVRVGDAMRLMDDLDMAMEIAGAAIRLAADAGARTESLDVLRSLYSKLQYSVGERRATVPA